MLDGRVTGIHVRGVHSSCAEQNRLLGHSLAITAACRQIARHELQEEPLCLLKMKAPTRDKEMQSPVGPKAAAPLPLELPKQSCPSRELIGKANFRGGHLQKSLQKHSVPHPKVSQKSLGGLSSKGTETIGQAACACGFCPCAYEGPDQTLGPQQFQRGGQDTEISYAFADTAIGPAMLGATGRGLCFLQFGKDRGSLMQAIENEYSSSETNPAKEQAQESFDSWIDQLNGYLSGNLWSLTFPLDIKGTAFQKIVWNYLQSIPYGQTRSYQEVAQALDKPKAARGVAAACARNKIALLIPCHRVVRSNGALAGYRWGLELKERLLALEKTRPL